MQVVVLTNDILKGELLSDASLQEEIIWIENLHQINEHPYADVFVDLLFDTAHITMLQSLLPKTVIINSVEKILSEIDPSFVRINAWPGFLKSSTIEASSLNDNNKQIAQKVFTLFEKKLEWLPDESGFVTPRVISMIINEAFIALKEGVSTREEIDTAMKLGTNYPYGPFEWAEKIGMERVHSLLVRLQKK
ncbi:MAG TPA: 3-hydroxyacyl-CoA dehydrogenase family protein [Flavisolibacter sp.]|nr:3-hydroxyacyl-CoA dehydrogenase family protein [Flavisolibacter sp.]